MDLNQTSLINTQKIRAYTPINTRTLLMYVRVFIGVYAWKCICMCECL